MTTKRATILSLLILALLVGPGSVAEATAGLRVRATVKMPGRCVPIENLSCGYHGRHDHGRGDHGRRDRCSQARHDLGRHDRAIARRLARYTDLTGRELLHLRRHGYRWAEIGRWLEMPRPMVRAARSAKSWQRFQRRARHASSLTCDLSPRPSRRHSH